MAGDKRGMHAMVHVHKRTHVHISAVFCPSNFHFRYSNLNPSFPPCHLFDSAANVA